MENPYAPTTVNTHPAKAEVPPKLPKPIVPAIIGLVTYGSCSPYALVLCIEQYLRPVSPRIPLMTHVAVVLSILGTSYWAVVSFGGVLMLVGASEMYQKVGLIICIANAIFLCWTYWRIRVFQKRGKRSV